MAKLLWLVLAMTAPAAHAAPGHEVPGESSRADGLLAWRAWFWSEPGGPLDAPGRAAPGEPFRVPGYQAPLPAPAAWADWRDFVADAAFSDVATGPDGLARVAYRHGGDVYLAQRTGAGASAGWRHERVGSTELEWGDLALALDSRGRAHVGYEATDVGGEKRWIHAVREPIGLWTRSTLPPAARTGRPWFSASPEGGLALYFRAQASFPTPMPSAPVRPWSRAWLLILAPGAGLGRLLLLARRLRARRRLRTEAALVGRGLLMDVVVRDRAGSRLRPAAAGVLLLHARTPVLFVDGLKPSEAWLGPEWSLSEGRPGWVEGRCGPVTLEFAPESGIWPSFTGRAARKILDAIRAERAARALKDSPGLSGPGAGRLVS